MRSLPTKILRTAALLVAALFLATVTGCTTISGSSGNDAATLATCPKAGLVADYVGIDGTGSNDSGRVFDNYLTALTSQVRHAVICSGHVKVVVFSDSIASTATLYDADVTLAGATANAKLRRVQPAVDAIIAQVRKGYPAARASLSQSGTDVLAQFQAATDYRQQLGHHVSLDVLLLTDGFQNVGFIFDTGTTIAGAKALADQQPVPNLTGAHIDVAGLGRIADTAPPSSLVAAESAFFTRLCTRAHAASCLAVSDWK